MDFKAILRTFLKIILPLAFGCLLLWYLYSKMDIGEIWNVIRKGVRYEIILFSLLFGLGANIIRGLRWGLLIRSLGDKVKTCNVIYAVLGNYAVNLVLPRVGEVWRCGMITKYDKIPFTRLLGTLLIDRVSDTIMVGLITMSIIIFNFDFFHSFFAKNPALLDGFQSMFNSIWIYVAGVIFIAGIWFIFTYMSNFTLVKKAKSMLQNIWDGMKSIWLMKRKGLFVIQTLLIWTGYFLYFYITFYAFDFTRDLGVTVGLIAFTMSSIAVAVPVQGGIGPWHFMVIATLMCFGVKETDAAAFALIYVAGVIFIAGIWFIFTYMSNFTLVKKAKSMLQNIWDGMKSIWLMKRKGLFVIQTLLIWTGYFLYFYITFYAFDFTRDLGVTVGLIAFTMSSIAVAVPVQGGIGPWHFMVIATLMCFGVKETDAAAFALVVHTVQTAWLGITGLFGVVALPFVNKGIDNGQLTIDN